jgi:hypothetical protein
VFSSAPSWNDGKEPGYPKQVVRCDYRGGPPVYPQLATVAYDVTAGLGGYQFRRERRGPRTHLPQRRPGPERRLTRWVGRRRSWLGARLARDGAKKSALDPWTR